MRDDLRARLTALDLTRERLDELYPDELLRHALNAPSQYTDEFRLLAAEVLRLRAALQRESPDTGAEKLLTRYLDNHCANADAEGMSVLCECKLCRDTRTYLGMPTWERAAAPEAP